MIKKHILFLLLFSGCYLQAQELFLATGKNFTKYDYKNSIIMKNLLHRLIKKKKKEVQINEKEIIFFYKQLIKMKVKRPYLNAILILKKCYPNIKDKLSKIIEEHEHSNYN